MHEGSRSELERLADLAFVYGMGLVEDVGKLVEQVTTPGIPLGAPLNAFGHGRELFDAQRGREMGLVGINTDTLYSCAQVDVCPGPVILAVPDAAGRYYVMQFVDAWTNDFAYVGLRRFEPLGLLAGDSPYVDPDPELAEILRSAAAAGPDAVMTASTKLLAARGQWLETRKNFNFNQHFFELGTIDEPNWEIADRERAWLQRAAKRSPRSGATTLMRPTTHGASMTPTASR